MKIKIKKIGFNVFSAQIVYLCIIIIFAVVFSIVMPGSVYLDLFIIFLTASSSIYVCFKEIKNRKYRVDELVKSLDISLKDNLNLVDIPMAIISNSVDVVWQNKLCMRTITNEHIINVAIDIENKMKNSLPLKTQLNIDSDTNYVVVGNNIKFADFSSLLICFIDDSNEYKLKNILDNKEVTIGIVFIDNYDETMQGLDEIVKADITSKIDKEIRKWVRGNFGVVSKLDKDRYAIFIEKQYIKQMEESNFEILEKIRNITDITKLPVTISIGMSYSADSLNDRYVESSSALDVALGRGGDQVVIKNEKNFNFYGGTNLRLEKTSRVRARTIAQALRDIIEKVDNVYIVGHKNSDIDCIGAAVGIFKITSYLKKPANIIVDNKCNDSAQFVIDRLKTQKEYENVFIAKDELKKINTENSLLVVVDTHKKTYVLAKELLEQIEKVVVIDHHRRGPEFIDNALLTYHEIYSSSTSELVTELLMYLDTIKLTAIEAEALYAGILVDTKNFTFKTGVRTFEVAAYLKKSGLDISEAKQVFKNDFNTYVSKVEIVKNAELIDNKIAISMTNAKDDNIPIIAAQAADELLSISGIVASFVLCKVDDVVMISGRSMGDINVQIILENMGGGGHLTFAGAQIAGVELEEAKQMLLENIKNYFSKGEDQV